MIIEKPDTARDLKTLSLTADLVVVGGGLAGTCCAITAAREGVKVILIQDRPVLGGNASSEVRLWMLGATSHMGNKKSGWPCRADTAGRDRLRLLRVLAATAPSKRSASSCCFRAADCAFRRGTTGDGLYPAVRHHNTWVAAKDDPAPALTLTWKQPRKSFITHCPLRIFRSPQAIKQDQSGQAA